MSTRSFGLLVTLVALASSSACEHTTTDDARLPRVGIAQALLHETDVLEALGRRDQAIARAERVLAIELAPHDPLREPLRIEAHTRIAELRLAAHDLDGAGRAIEGALAEVRGHSYFEARIYIVRGRWHEARAARLATEGDTSARDGELAAALADHETSITINEVLLAEGDSP